MNALLASCYTNRCTRVLTLFQFINIKSIYDASHFIEFKISNVLSFSQPLTAQNGNHEHKSIYIIKHSKDLSRELAFIAFAVETLGLWYDGIGNVRNDGKLGCYCYFKISK